MSNPCRFTVQGRRRGFTLIELIVAVAMVAILATVALPSYQSHLRKSYRAEAQAYLMAVAARQQQFLLDTHAYAATLVDVGVPVPANVAARYTLTLALADGPPPTFLAKATPLAAQTADACATLSIDQAGAKLPGERGCW